MKKTIHITTSQIQQLFREKMKGKNVMTPDTIAYGKSGPYVFEITEGTGFDHEPIFGVSVLTVDGDYVAHLSKMHKSLSQAHSYAKSLKSMPSEEKDEKAS